MVSGGGGEESSWVERNRNVVVDLLVVGKQKMCVVCGSEGNATKKFLRWWFL